MASVVARALDSLLSATLIVEAENYPCMGQVLKWHMCINSVLIPLIRIQSQNQGVVGLY